MKPRHQTKDRVTAARERLEQLLERREASLEGGRGLGPSPQAIRDAERALRRAEARAGNTT